MSRKKILVVGGTGYLGQHVLGGFCVCNDYDYEVAFTYNSQPPPSFPHSLAFPLDLRSGHGFHAISQSFGQPHVVVNCAALSVPRACEADPCAAMSINVPSSLLNWLSTFPQHNTLLIHLSTDQVYQGLNSFYKEQDHTLPVNAYGKSKVAAEQFISQNTSNFAILRSSIIYGPQPVSPIPKSLPLQWIDGVLSKGDAVDFFHDEYRCPVYVKDVVTIILTLANKWISEGKAMQIILNVGGPDRVSRVQMAEAVAHFRGYDKSLVKSVSASSVDRGVKSPADISMDITKLVQTLQISPTPFTDGVRLTLEPETSS